MKKKILVGVLSTLAITTAVVSVVTTNKLSNSLKASEYDVVEGTVTIDQTTIVRDETDLRHGYVLTNRGNKIRFYTTNNLYYENGNFSIFTTSTGLYLNDGFQTLHSITIYYTTDGYDNLEIAWGNYSGDWTKASSNAQNGVEIVNPDTSYTHFNLWSRCDCYISRIVVKYSCSK